MTMIEREHLKRMQAAALTGSKQFVQVSGRNVQAHTLTWLTLLAAGALVVNIPQLSAIAALPDLRPGPTLLPQIVLLTLRVLFTVLYTGLWLCVVPGPAAGSDDRYARGSLMRASDWAERVIGRRLDRLNALLGDDLRWSVSIVALGTAMVLGPWIVGGVWDPLPVGFHLGMTGAWFLPPVQRLFAWLLRRWHSLDRGSTAANGSDTAAMTVLGRAITIVLLTNIAGEALWWVQKSLGHGLAFRVYSSWAIVQVMFVFFLGVRAVDALARLRMPWVRTTCVGGLIVGTILFPGGETVGRRVGAAQTALAAPTKAAHPWFDAVFERLDTIPSDHPVIVVAASGGGSRAAIFAALVYEKLHSLPATTDLTDSTKSMRRSLAQDVLLVSSVSGGSLASAYFMSPPTTKASDRPHSTVQGSKSESTADSDALDPVGSAFVNDMATDFMAPLLRGVLNVLQGRGASVSHFWGDLYGWNEVQDNAARRHAGPITLFNATSIYSGQRVTVGFPALEQGLLGQALALADVDAGTSLTLAEAVRVSANFPYGFDYAVLDVEPRPSRETQDQQVIDGGVVDNTGLDTLAMLFSRLVEVSAAPSNERDKALSEPARQLLQRLRDHGVIVLEIDAGARPGRPSWLAERLPSLTKPLQAMEQASHLNASVIRERNLERIRQQLVVADDKVPALVGVVRAGFACRPKGDVMTAWALDLDDQRDIFQGFAQVEARLARGLRTQFAAIATVHAARRAATDDTNPSSTHANAANGLRSQFASYLKQWTDTDAEQRKGALQCGVMLPGAQDDRYEAELRSALEERWLAAVTSAPGTMAAPLALQSSTAPNPQALAQASHSTPPKPDREQESSRRKDESLGWIYVGDYQGGRWGSRYLQWSGLDLPDPGATLTVLGRSNVRSSMPNEVGELGRERMTLRKDTSVRLLEVQRWQDTGLTWARIGAVRPAAD
jgi:hypothetical protein